MNDVDSVNYSVRDIAKKQEDIDESNLSCLIYKKKSDQTFSYPIYGERKKILFEENVYLSGNSPIPLLSNNETANIPPGIWMISYSNIETNLQLNDNIFSTASFSKTFDIILMFVFVDIVTGTERVINVNYSVFKNFLTLFYSKVIMQPIRHHEYSGTASSSSFLMDIPETATLELFVTIKNAFSSNVDAGNSLVDYIRISSGMEVSLVKISDR